MSGRPPGVFSLPDGYREIRTVNLARQRGPALIVSALAPVVLFSVLFLVLALLLPPAWYWHAQLFQAYNLAGAAGDYYIVALVAKMPAGLLARDTGFEMKFYAPEK